VKSVEPTPTDINVVRQARAAVQAGDFAGAHRWLDPLIRSRPGLAEARHLMGALLRAEGDLVAAEREVRTAVRLSGDRAVLRISLARILFELGRDVEGERELMAALRAEPGDRATLALLIPLLQSRAAWPEVVALTDGLPPENLSPVVHEMRVEALTALDRGEAALQASQAWISAHPADGKAELTLGHMLGAQGDLPEAEAAARRALAKGAREPATWLLAARTAMRQGRLDEAEADFRQLLRATPDHPEAHNDLAELLWMRTGDRVIAMETFERCLAESDSEGLWWLKPKIASFIAGLEAGADAAEAAARRFPDHPSFALLASQSAAEADRPEKALRFAEQVWAAAPDSVPATGVMLYAHLAAGNPDEAVKYAEAMRRLRAPNDQFAIAMLATAWRVAGDPRGAELYDYDGLVRTYRLQTPEGWSSLDAFLADLKGALQGQHYYKAHPFNQSIRHGSQTMQGLLTSKDPVVRAFFAAVSKSIDEHVRYLGQGTDVLRARNTGKWRFEGAWSVLLKREGRHVDHVHPAGWLSSAFYVEAPKAAVEGADRGGWIKFGEPGMITRPRLEPERFVKPEPGMLVLFPSYMWHGTVPFTTDEQRLTVAFDVVPT
jgi:uncharacterized protein (TIGR02466 family)